MPVYNYFLQLNFLYEKVFVDVFLDYYFYPLLHLNFLLVYHIFFKKKRKYFYFLIIYNIDKDIEYTVTEAYNEFYTAASANASGIVLEKTISEVNFVNSPKGYGSLLVEKEVIHPFESISAQLANKEFDIKVEFEGNANDLAQISAPIAAAKVSDGIYTLKLKGGHDALFTHIPDSVKYTVTEQNIPKGFSLIRP